MDLLPLQSDSDCPDPEAVQAEVRELTTPEQRHGVPADAKVLVSDRGDSIAVAITRDGKTTVRVYRDEARDCARRAHFVSVLVVVALMPPEVASEPEPTPEPEPPPAPAPVRPEPAPAPPEAPVPAPPHRVRIELAARGEVGTPISDSVRVAQVGGTLGVALGAGRLRFTLATGYSPATTLRYTGASAGSAELERLDIALGVRLMLSTTPVATGIDASVLATRAEVTGLSAHRPAQDTAFSVGGRLGLRVASSDDALLSPFLSAHVAAFPLPPELAQLPQGTVGHLPYVWLGLSGGLALAL
ncbi:MAG TPA: hypothetical protein VHB79_28395 [Polyangiaceae bacterium]|nr:hypothetical protein [Polyangiaceae bacterium]